MSGKRWLALGIAGLLFFVSIITSMATSKSEGLSNALATDLFNTEEVFMEKVLENGNINRKVLVMELNGVIQDTGESLFMTSGYQHRKFLKMLDQAKEDDGVKGIILKVNTPGGGVYESAEIHRKLVEIKEETDKPIYISMGSMAASGGYYISAPADKIFATPETLTGSIGVIMQGINFGELAERYGVKFETIKSGEYKDILSQTRDMTESERSILQDMVDSMYSRFVDVIVDGRNMSEAEVRQVADGRIYDGVQAKDINLVDELGYYDDVLDALKEDYKLGNVQVVQYQENIGLGSLFLMKTSSLFQQNAEMQLLSTLFSQPNAPRLMYLYAE
ncbi:MULTISPECIES: signal peptide peptidase SppA [Sutcliffiella]|uniref:signal peptide peptidase SppA n=1 Tax=Sutcliffiella TaxID=2837511 RepID=UPI0022DCF8EB|nr:MULTISPECIES: signal peptide peptidase SppA [Sutcliffiella]MED4016189.1 signal peptide peptidase SppA [Sutcliffiella cohnii]WBL14114.1 signal peptide peptidase SppA [Sutcliffiella sp. NC1]